MSVILDMFKSSAKELKNSSCIAVTGILIAAYIAIEAFFSIDTGILKINFAFLALAVVGMLYGPVVCLLAAIPCDIIGASVKGGGLIFIFTLIAMFEGMIYGLFLYRTKPKYKKKFAFRVITVQSIVVLISHLIFNTSAIYLLGFGGKTYDSLFWFIISRVIKNLIELPVDIALLLLLLVPAKTAYMKVIGD